MTAPGSQDPNQVSSEEFELFLHSLIHEIRNRLNGIALAATDLTEQAGPHANDARLQQQIQECSVFLKKVRDALAPDDPAAVRARVADFAKKLRER